MKKDNKKNIIILLLTIIIIILSVIIALILTGKINLNQTTEETSTKEEQQEETNIKIDKNLEYVYDANYTYNNKYIEFERASLENKNSKEKLSYFGIEVEYTLGTQYLSNLKVPYININTEVAKNINKELENLYLEYAKDFDSCAEIAKNDTNSHSCSQILTYRTYKFNDILSIVVIDSSQSTSPWILNYNIYNFDLKTGKQINYNDLLSKLNYNSTETLNNAENLIKNKMESLYGEHEKDLSTACTETSYDSNNNLISNNINCYEKANELLEKSINENTILAFSDNEGILNILAIPYYNGVQNGDLNHYLIKIEK